MTEPARGGRGRGWRHYAATAALTGLVFLAVRGCVYEYAVQDMLRERAQAARPPPPRAAIAPERAAVVPSAPTSRLVTIAPVAEAPTTGGVFLLTERKCADQTTLAAFADTSKMVTAWGCAHHTGVQVSITWVDGNPNYFASPTSTVTPGSWQKPSAVYTAAAP